MDEKRITPADLIEKKKNKEKIISITSYDFRIAKIVDEAGLNFILVGDSVAMAIQGMPDTLSVTMDEMIYHTKMVSRATKRALVIGDMPFMSYQASLDEAIKNAGRFLKEGRAQAVKLEGGVRVVSLVKKFVEIGIPVMGHIGLTPQSVNVFGGFKVQGKEKEDALKIIEDAKALEDAGCFSIVLESIPYELSKVITETLNVPTIGIGAGPYCDGQILVITDILGLDKEFSPKFAKKYVDLYSVIYDALKNYENDVKAGNFPLKEHSFLMKKEILDEVLKEIKK